MRKIAVALVLAGWTLSSAQGASVAGKAPAKAAARPAAAVRAAPAAVVVKPGYAVTIGAVPSWVVPTPLPEGAPAESSAMHYRLIDEQVRVDAASSAEYERLVRVVNQAAGLGTAAQFELEYDPAYESIVLHGLEVVRGGQRLQRLNRDRIELLQREKQLEQRIYDGRITVSVVVEDVRVGDEIDLSYTRIGQNPVFGGRFVRHGWLSSLRGPVRMYRTRLLAPQTRQIRHAVGSADVVVATKTVDGWRDTSFVREQVPQLHFEPGVPYGAFRGEILQFSEFGDWAEVAAWGERLFADAAVGARTAERAAEIRAAQATPAAQALEALRFVQQEVRYFGVEMGASSHRPNPADQVLQQRFGDCKDKVTLLAGLLRSMQVPVRPVLVSTRLRERVDGWLASPLVFDHVIARVDVDAKPLYLDPTRGHQSGPLEVRPVVGFGQGLELAPGVTGLVALPSAQDSERMRVEDRFIVQKFSEPVTLESRIVYRGDLAEAFRETLAAQGIGPVGDLLGGPYVKAYPQLKRLGPPVTEAVEGDDALAIVQRFELPSFWRFPEQRVLAGDLALWAPVEMLLPPKMEARQKPMRFAFPGITRHVATVQFAEDVTRQTASRSAEEGDGHFRLVLKQSSAPREIQFAAEARITADQVEPAQWAGFTATLTKALPKLSSAAVVPAIPPDRSDAVQATLRALENDLRRGKVKVVTSTQVESHFKATLLTAQLDAGRLAPPLRAEALVARGIAFDHLGRLDEARADFEAAMALDADSADALNAAATNARSRGDFGRAIELAGRVLARQPRDAQALGTRALAHYMAGRIDAARADWEAVLEDRANVRRGYPLALLALATRRAGGDVAALKQRYPQDQWPSDWPRAVVAMALDGGDGSTLLADARSQKRAVEAQTEADFYLGEMAAAAGDLRKARDHWQRAVGYGVVEFVEYNAAQQRLKEPR